MAQKLENIKKNSPFKIDLLLLEKTLVLPGIYPRKPKLDFKHYDYCLSLAQQFTNSKPKVMKPFQVKNLITFFGLFFIVMLCSLGTSCNNNSSSEISEKPQQDTLPNTLDSSEAIIFEANYYDASKGDLDSDFYFDPGGKGQQKVIAFSLNPAQQQNFFQELIDFKNAQQDTSFKDSVCLRVHLGAFTDQQFKKPKQANITPLLQIVNTKTYKNSPSYYPLRAFYNPDTNTLTNKRTSAFPAIAITKAQVHQFVDSWLKVPYDSTADQLCLRDKPRPNCEKVKYYTVRALDTQDIYRFLLKYQSKDKFNCYFYVYLGVETDNGEVNLRTIMHISTKQLRVKGSSSPADEEEGGEEDFEFPMPCPTYCDPE